MSRSPETPLEAALRLAAGAIRDGYVFQAIHTYTDPHGYPLHWKIRAKHPAGNHNKWIKPMKLNGQGFTLGEPTYLDGKPLYRLHELWAAPLDADNFIVEGEGCADALADLGVLATTSGSATSADGADWRPLARRSVVIWPDNDMDGTVYQQKVADCLFPLGATIRAIDVAALGLPEKGDASDWLAAHPGATTEDVAALPTVDVQPVYTIPRANAWPDRRPIIGVLKAVPAFDWETLLPEPIRDWVVDEADRMPCPPDFIAAAAMVALGSIVGARCVIKPKARDSWCVVPNLWGAIVGDPSAKKSPAAGAGVKSLDRLIAKARETYEEALAEFGTVKVVFEAQKDAIANRIKVAAKAPTKGDPASIAKELRAHEGQAPNMPVLRRYKTNDCTVEKLGELLRDNPTGVLVLRDELVGLIATWEREGREGERAFFLEGWNGDQSFDTDRIGRGHISIPNLCLSIFGGIQPDKLTAYLELAEHSLANDGMLQRFQMLVYPDAQRWEWRDRAPDKRARDRAFAVFEALADFDPVAWGAISPDDFTKFPHFRFNDAAQRIFIEWSEDMHRKRLAQEDEPIIQQHLAKFDKLFPALALIFHLVDCAASGARGPVLKEATLRAAAWCEYLEAHARRCYGLLKDDGLRAAQALAAKLEQGALADSFTLRDVRRYQWRGLTTDDAIQAALDWLEDDGWLRSESTGGTGPGSGRPTKRYRIHPDISANYQDGA